MKVIVLLSLLGLALAAPEVTWETSYHENVGIPQAERIKAIEEATDFDGTRIVGGSAASLGQYPHLGGLLITLVTGQTSVCGSSLLSNTVILTAAHCWWDGRNQARQFVVVLGSVRLFSGGTRVTTTNVRMHERWNPAQSMNSDIAVAYINRVNYNNVISNINLPSGNQLTNQFVGYNAWAAGFGVQRDGTGISTNQALHHVSLRVISNADCRRRFPIVNNSHICIDGAGGRSTCGGDSGGPLQIGTGTGATLIGVTSFGFALGCERGWPAAFARVTTYNAWIRARM